MSCPSFRSHTFKQYLYRFLAKECSMSADIALIYCFNTLMSRLFALFYFERTGQFLVVRKQLLNFNV